MGVNTINISFNKEMLDKIDKISKEENRSRSELIREAARMYIERKKRWEQIFIYGDYRNQLTKITEKEIESEIHNYRRRSRK